MRQTHPVTSLARQIPPTGEGLVKCLHTSHVICQGSWQIDEFNQADSICSVCHSSADIFGDHHVGCGGNGDRIHRHNSIRDAIFTAAQSAALAPLKEFSHLIPNRQSRPADIFLPNWDRGRSAALDVSVISTLQNLTVSGAASTSGYALQVGEAKKKATLEAHCNTAGISFVPFLFESLGGISDLASKTIRRIGRHLGQRVGAPPAWSHLQALSSFKSVLLTSGEETPPFGSIAFPQFLQAWME